MVQTKTMAFVPLSVPFSADNNHASFKNCPPTTVGRGSFMAIITVTRGFA